MPQEPRDHHDGSQIRGIINKINAKRSSQEESREVLVSEDGTKLTKVVKKRRVILSDKDKRRGLSLRYIIATALCFVLVMGLSLYYFIQWLALTGAGYLQSQKVALQSALHAESVEWQQPDINGFQLRAGQLRLRFPQNSALQEVVLKNLSAKISPLSIFAGPLCLEDLHVQDVHLVLRKGARHMQLPATQLAPLCTFSRLNVDSLNLSVAGEAPPFSLSKAKAYLYYPEGAGDRMQLSLSSGTWDVAGWTSFDIKDFRLVFEEARCQIYAQLVQESTNTLKGLVGGGHLELYQEVVEGECFYGPYQFLSEGFDLAFLSDARLKPFLSAQTMKEAGMPLRESKALLCLSENGEAPSIEGTLSLGQVCWKSLPALKELAKHVEGGKRDFYKSPIISKGKVYLKSKPEGICLSFEEGDMMEPHKLSLSGSVMMDAANSLSGNLEYALPLELTRAEYPDEISDPIFVEYNSAARLKTVLKGFAFVPDDNSHQLEQAAKKERVKRPSPNPIEHASIESMYQRMEEANQHADGAK